MTPEHIIVRALRDGTEIHHTTRSFRLVPLTGTSTKFSGSITLLLAFYCECLKDKHKKTCTDNNWIKLELNELVPRQWVRPKTVEAYYAGFGSMTPCEAPDTHCKNIFLGIYIR